MKSNILILFLLSLITFLSANTSQEEELALHHFMQGEFLMNQGNYALAVLEFQDAINLDPNASTIHVSIADAYRRIGKNRHAENHLRTALELDPEDTEAREMLGQLYILKKDAGSAKLEFMKLLEIDPENIDYYFMLADLARLQKNWNQAIDYYIKAFEINSMAITGLEQALQIALTTNNFDRAEEVCLLLLEDDPENVTYLESFRDLTLFSKKYDMALDAVSKMESVLGPSTEFFLQKSALFEELGNMDQALQSLVDALEHDSPNVDILHRLVTLLLGKDNYEQAILYNQRILVNFPNDPRGFINSAVIAMSLKKPEDAILALSPHVDKFSKDFTIQYLLGTAFYQVKDYGNSELHLSQALAIFPESKNTKHNLALIYDSNGDWTKSDKLYMELIAADSSDAQAFNNYAYSLVERGIDIEFALELAKNAIRLTPNSAPYLDTIGWIYYKLNLFDEALSYIFESLSIDGENETIQNHLEEVTKAKQDQTTPIIQQTEKQD